MITKINLNQLHVPENAQLLISADAIFTGHNTPERERLAPFYDKLHATCIAIKGAQIIAEKNTKIGDKHAADKLRLCRHSRLFSFTKAFIYDDSDPRYPHALAVMKIIKELGSPYNLSESKESALFTTLGNTLTTTYANDVEAIGATALVAEMMAAHSTFLTLEEESRKFAAQQDLAAQPSLGDLCKEGNATLRVLVNSLNTFIGLDTTNAYSALESDLNTLIAKYDHVLSVRRSSKAAATTEEEVKS